MEGNTNSREGNYSLRQVLNEYNIEDVHFIVSAWISRGSALTMLLCQKLGWSTKEGNFQLSQLNTNVLADPKFEKNNWPAFRKLCDRVNYNFETGTLLPTHNITMIPAFTTRGPIDLPRAKLALKDVAVAHEQFASNKKLVYLITWGNDMPGTHVVTIKQAFSEVEHDIFHFDESGFSVDI